MTIILETHLTEYCTLISLIYSTPGVIQKLALLDAADHTKKSILCQHFKTELLILPIWDGVFLLVCLFICVFRSLWFGVK